MVKTFLFGLLAALVISAPSLSAQVVITPAPIPSVSVGCVLQVQSVSPTVWICGAAGSGTVTVTGTRTAGVLTKFSSDGVITNSIASESGSTITVAGTLNATTLQVGGCSINTAGCLGNVVYVSTAPALTGTNFTGIPWAGVSKTSSSLADLATRAVSNLSDGSNVALLNTSNVFTGSVLEIDSATSATFRMDRGTSSNLHVMSYQTANANDWDVYTTASATPTMEWYSYHKTGAAGAVMALTATGGLLRLHSYGAGTLVTDSSGNVTASSDERLKDITGQFRAGLNAIMGLRPILHRWKPETGYDVENVYASWSAQNVLAFVPEAVGVGLNGLYTVNDRPVLLAAVNAIRELAAEIDDLRAAAKLPAKNRGMAPIAGDSRAIKSATTVRLAEVAKEAEWRKAKAAEACEARNAKIVKQGGKPVPCEAGR